MHSQKNSRRPISQRGGVRRGPPHLIQSASGKSAGNYQRCPLIRQTHNTFSVGLLFEKDCPRGGLGLSGTIRAPPVCARQRMLHAAGRGGPYGVSYGLDVSRRMLRQRRKLVYPSRRPNPCVDMVVALEYGSNAECCERKPACSKGSHSHDKGGAASGCERRANQRPKDNDATQVDGVIQGCWEVDASRQEGDRAVTVTVDAALGSWLTQSVTRTADGKCGAD